VVYLALETTGRDPAVVPLLFNALRLIRFGDFGLRKEE
jgi:hypothetical protein